MPGNGHIGGGGSCHVYFKVTGGEEKCVHDDLAVVKKSMITVTFPKAGTVVPARDPKGDSVTVLLEDGDTVRFNWT
jgi:hypothetical protein